jgi:gamma-glutamylputrescine oxidase
MPASNNQSLHPQSYYLDTLAYPRQWAALEQDASCDVCVIGGGFTGVSAALNLAEKGFKVILLEAQYIGWGASGRNGGQAGGMPRQDQEELESKYGADAARRHWEINQAALTEMKQRIERHAITCDWRDGIASVCRRKGEEKWYQQYAEKLQQQYQADFIEYLDAAEMARLLDTPHCYGGMLDRSSGHIHPLNFTRGMAVAATEAGATIHERTPVKSYSSDTNGCRISTANGVVTSRYIVLGCNGYLEKLAPEVAGKIMPINNYMLATAPLTPAQVESVSAQGYAFYDTRFVVNYWRLSADNRLLFGGGENYTRRFPADIKSFVRKYMLQVYPGLESCAIDYGWGGTLAVTMNRMPHFGRVPGKNVYYAQGYSGHGVVLASFAGKLIADALAGDAERFDLLANVPIPTFPGGTLLRWPGLVAAMFYYTLRDKLG